DVVGLVRITQVALETVVAILLSVKVEITAVANLSAPGDFAGTTDKCGAGGHAGHAFVVDRRDDVETADGAFSGIGMIPRDGKYLGRATGSERSYSARRICAVTPVDARCVMARAGRGSGIGGVRLRSARVGESRHRLRTGVGADVGLKGEAAAGVHRRIANINGESFGIGLAVESIRDGNRHGVRSLFGVFVIFGRQRSRTVHGESSM